MKDFFQDSVFVGLLISLGSYGIGMWLRKKTKLSLINPLVISIIMVIAFLLITGMDYQTYCEGADGLNYLLTPATICLALPLYQQVELLKKNYRAVILGITAGVLSSLCTILLLALAFQFNHEIYVTLLPKSITTAIGIGMSEELGGIVSLTVVSIVITGVLGNVIAEKWLQICRIKDPIATGIAIGCASHAMGTAKAMEMGDVEGAMSGLSIVVSGVLTVVGATLFSYIY